MRGHLTVIGVLLAGMAAGAHALPVSPFDAQDYTTTVTTVPWAQPPSDHHRLFLDVYNVTDIFDSETGGVAGFTDQTVLADTVRPTATVLWDERFRIQLGAIAEKLYGDSVGFGKVDPWIQLLWRPIQPLNVILGNLDIPHYYLPALFYPTNYFTRENHETGMQLKFERPEWFDDLYFNYRLQDTPDHNEKFDFGFVHRNDWKWFSLIYQSHWIHEGGELNPHPLNTRNDVAQAGGLGVHGHPFGCASVMVGLDYTHLQSHVRQDSDTPALLFTQNGHGEFSQAYVRWARLKVIGGDWRGHDYSHEGGDPMFTLPVMDMLTLRWDILQARDFNLFAETTGYVVGSNSQGYGHDVKAAFHIQAAWQFSIPIVEWTSPAASSEGQPVPTRWDYGL